MKKVDPRSLRHSGLQRAVPVVTAVVVITVPIPVVAIMIVI